MSLAQNIKKGAVKEEQRGLGKSWAKAMLTVLTGRELQAQFSG